MKIKQANEKIKDYLRLKGETISDNIIKDGVITEETITFKVEEVIIAPWQGNRVPIIFWMHCGEKKDYQAALGGFTPYNYLEIVLVVKIIETEEQRDILALPEYLTQIKSADKL